jgi:hypothetical protein
MTSLGEYVKVEYLFKIAAHNQLPIIIKDPVALCPLLRGFRYEPHLRSEHNLSSW